MSNNCSCFSNYNSPVFPSQVNLGMSVKSGLRPGRALIDNLTVAAKLGLVKPALATSPPFASAQISGIDQTLAPPVNRVYVGQKRVSGYQTVSSLRIVDGGSGYTDTKNVSTVVADGLDTTGIPKPSVIKTFLASSINPDAPDPQPTPPANPQNQTKPPPSNQMRKYRTKVGKGLTVDITTSAGKIIAATINNPGFGYEAGSEIIVNSGGLDAILVIGLSSWVKGGQQVSQNSQSVAENINLATGARGGPVENYSNMRGSMISKTSSFVNTSHLEIPGRAISSAAASSTVIKPTFTGPNYEVEKNENTYAPCPINVVRGFTYKKKETALPSGVIEQNIPGKIIRAKFADPSANTFSRVKVTGGVASFFVLSGGNGYENGKLYRTNSQIETIDNKTYSSQGQSLEIRSQIDPVTTKLVGGVIINPGNNYRVGDQLRVEIPINEKTNTLTTAGVPIFAAPAVPTTSAVIQIISLSRDCVNQLQRNINTNNTLFATFTSSYV
jgi:hypothetical protein